MEVGKTVLIAGLGGTAAGALHFMWLAPQFAGQMIGPVKTSTIIDLVVAFIAGIVTTMYTSSWDMIRILGFSMATLFAAIGIMDQFNLLTPATPAQVAAPQSVFAPSALAMVPRASYLAPPGVIVNKHGSVPEVAAGTFG